MGNILPRRITKLTSKKQRKVSKLIKIARNFLLV
ncbi:ribosomal protein S18 [Candidatus Pinguicoccus supinus]|uniref:Ribosomal protein S18 n=1 Tax=Candidatus Pinguicoccus supinus TaxID=2529394 RepID=A0A7T0BSP0_9BACT|nr:ribosomal protein S18 [Candidatus Pinguicoccus supinus]